MRALRIKMAAHVLAQPNVACFVLVGAGLVALTVLGPGLHHKFGGMAHWAIVVLTAAGAAWATYAGDRIEQKTALIVILVVAVLMRLSQLAIEPYLSSDIYRYVWDGRVQAAGINPYRYIPAAPELAHLRDAVIYPHINRADYAPTIYPPIAQMFYLAVTRLGESVLVMKLALVACEAGAIAATLAMLARLGLPPTRIAAFAWHPLAVWEIAGSGHVDALMVALMMAGLVVFLANRTLIAGAIVTAAALVKPTALLALPVFWRPWNIALPVVVAATAIVLYAPYLAVGTKVFGFLSGYVAEEDLTQGYGFRYLIIVDWLFGKIPHITTAYLGLAAVTVVALALWAGFRRDRSAQGSVDALVVLLAVFLVFLTPHYPWYYLVLVPFLAVHPWSWTLWALSVGGIQTYHAVPDIWLPDYQWRQVVFHMLVLAALARDVYVVRGRLQRARIEGVQL